MLGLLVKHVSLRSLAECKGRFELLDHGMLHVSRQWIINPGKVCSNHRTNAWQNIEPESQEGARSNIGVEKARLTIADGSMSHIL